MANPRIAVIGAGLSGLVLANRLHSHADVQIFEKSRGVSGRMSTRYADQFQFDHGAQYFTAQTEQFRAFLHPYLQTGVVTQWSPKLVHIDRTGEVTPWQDDTVRYVARPRMNSLAKAVAEKLTVQLNTHIEKLTRDAQVWWLHDKAGSHHGPFDWVISTAPHPQSHALLPDEVSFSSHLDIVQMVGCFTLMLGFEEVRTPPDEWEAARVDGPVIGWICQDGAKPDRPHAGALVIQAHNDWAETHLEEDPEWVREMLTQEASRLMRVDLSAPDYQSLHRWRYANTISKPIEENILLDQQLQVAAAGDWTAGGKVEAAFLSADMLAIRLMEHLAS